MNKELEEAKVLLSNLKNTTNTQEYVNNFSIYDNAIETVLNYIENSISKETIKEKIEEMQEEFKKLDKETDKYLKEDNKDLIKYYEQRERTAVIQTIGWAIGKFEDLLEKK